MYKTFNALIDTLNDIHNPYLEKMSIMFEVHPSERGI